jgi:hypothetical protein
MRDLLEEAGVSPDAKSSGPRDLFVEAGLNVPAAVSAGRTLNDIPRQLGLTARYGLEGLANTAQAVTEPLRYLTDRVTGMTGRTKPLGAMASQLADTIGLPSPENANERVIGDATRLVAGAGGMGGAAQVGARLPGMVGNVMTGLAANPTQQLTSAAGAGLAGGASREAGGNPLMQAGASLVGGVAGGLAPGIGQSLVDLTKRAAAPTLTPQQLDVQLSTVLGRAGTDYSKLPANVQASLRAELADSLQAGKQLDPQSVSRLADFKTVGATPTRGMISQNPVQITREQNLAKMAANSADDGLHGLPLMQNQNNTALIGRLNGLGGGTETAPITAGRAVLGGVVTKASALETAERGAWDAAKGMPGYADGQMSNAPVHSAFKAAADTGLLDYLPGPVASRMEAYMTGKAPFTPQEYANLRSMVSGSLSPTANANEKKVAKAVADALDAADIRMRTTNPGGIDYGNLPSTAATAARMQAADAAPQGVVDAINSARSATAAKYRYQESSPLVRAALSDARTADPEKIAQSFILNGTVNDARSVAQEVGPQGIPVIRDALATFIKKQALSGAADEVGKVSQSRLNSAINKIGEEKLGMFFSPEEVSQLRATGRVASLMQSQPVGSAVNNSNSGALLLGRGMDLLNGVAGKIPFGKAAVIDPLRNINISISQRQAQNVVPGLLAPVEKQPFTPSLLLPALAAGGGLLSPQ